MKRKTSLWLIYLFVRALVVAAPNLAEPLAIK